jgi:hypothetical protein
VLITDLHMLHAGEGFTVVRAVRHSQPAALTLLVSGYPDVRRTMAAILLKEEEIIVKPRFGTRQNDMNHLDFSLLWFDVMTIADEVDSQLSQSTGQLHEARAQNGSVARLLRFRAIGNKLRRGLRSFFSHR